MPIADTCEPVLRDAFLLVILQRNGALACNFLARMLYKGTSWTGRDGPHMQVAADTARQQLERSRTTAGTARLLPAGLAASLELHELQAAITVDHSGGVGLAPGAEQAAFLASKRAMQQEQQRRKRQEGMAAHDACLDVAIGHYAQRMCPYKVLELGHLSVEASVQSAQRATQDEGTDRPLPVRFTIAQLCC
jgi:hypothetical protein